LQKNKIFSIIKIGGTMENIKKYEIYIDKQKKGILNINWLVTKKVMAFSIAGIITATTLTGCSFKNTSIVTVEETQEIEFDNIDLEIKSKLFFVDSLLEKITNYQHPLYLQIMEPYKQYKQLEEELNPKNEYILFYTEEEILNKKYMMVNHLDESIRIIERNTKYKFGEDFLLSNKTK